MLFSSALILLVLLSLRGVGVVTSSSAEEAKDRKLQAGEEAATCQWVQVGQDVSSQFSVQCVRELAFC